MASSTRVVPSFRGDEFNVLKSINVPNFNGSFTRIHRIAENPISDLEIKKAILEIRISMERFQNGALAMIEDLKGMLTEEERGML